jgi:type VI secretion system protein ImpF
MTITAATAPVPLFDRLSGMLAAAGDGRLLSADGLQDSLQQDLLRLFNVRNGLTIEHFLTDAPTALDYGLPDTLALSPRSSADLARWEMVVAHAIALYEPRLAKVRVRVVPHERNPMAVRVHIAAAVALGWHLCQMHFDVLLDGRAACVAAAA